MAISLHNMDCIKVMETIPDASIDLILTDPPYNIGNFMKHRGTSLQSMRKNFFGAAGWDNMDTDTWLTMMDSFFAAANRVLKKGGALLMFMAVIKVESVIAIAQKYGFYYKTTGVWHKKNPMPRNMNYHFINSTEVWLYFIRGGRTGTFNNDGAVIHDFIETAVTPSSERTYGKHPTQNHWH